MNSVDLSGRLATQPDFRKTLQDERVCSFRLAVARPGTKDKTDFIPCVAWHETAEFIEKNFIKGQFMELHGILQIHEWTDSAGNRKFKAEVKCEWAGFGGIKKPTLTGSGSEEPFYLKGDTVDFDKTADLPF